MADYNSQSIDIDLEDVFNNLSDEGQEKFLTDMFRNLSDEDSRKNVVEDNMQYLDNDKAIDIIVQAFENMDSSDKKEVAERIANALTPYQSEELIKYIQED